MNDQNPYSTPEAPLDSHSSGGTYNPSIFSFNGRIGRLRYLAYNVGLNILLLVALVPMAILSDLARGGSEMPVLAMAGLGICYAVAIVFGVMYGKRRLNDLNHSGWLLLLFIIPLVNLFIAIYLLFFRGSDGDNNFGPQPVANTLGVKILAWLLPALGILGILAALILPTMQGYS